jgi:hypothetical protein
MSEKTKWRESYKPAAPRQNILRVAIKRLVSQSPRSVLDAGSSDLFVGTS